MQGEKLRISIALNQLDQRRVFQKKNGDLMLDFVAVPCNSPYGDTHFIMQSLTKEERAAKVKMPILGNVKLMFPPKPGDAPRPPAPQPRPQAVPTKNQGTKQWRNDDDGPAPF